MIEAAARAAGWKSADCRPAAAATGATVRGAGFAFARYKNQAAYVALVAEVAVDRADGTIRVERMTAAVDAGDVVNPDGLRNQIEGGMMQAASWTLYEEVAFDRERITSVDWRSYPIARFPAAPVVSVEVIERPERSAGRRRRGGAGSRRGGDRERRLRRDRGAPARPAAAAGARSRGALGLAPSSAPTTSSYANGKHHSRNYLRHRQHALQVVDRGRLHQMLVEARLARPKAVLLLAVAGERHQHRPSSSRWPRSSRAT